MTVELTKGTITQFLQGPKTGKFTTRDGKVLTFKLDLVQDETLRRELESGWLPDLEIPITVGLYRSPSGIVVTHITRLSTSGSQALPAAEGPYRNAKEAYRANNYRLAEELFLEAIRKGDRQLSAVKDLASMLNERGRTQEAIMLLNQFLMTRNVEKEEQAKLKKLRQNIHDAMPHTVLPAASQAFREKIVGALAHVPPAAPKPVPSFAPAPIETTVEYLCLNQEKHSFRLIPWREDLATPELPWPSASHFKPSEPWKLSLAKFSVGPDRTVLSEGIGVEPRTLPGAWVLPLSLAEWQISLPSPVRLDPAQDIYFRDDDILAGPWRVTGDGLAKASNDDFVYEWTWEDSWRRLDFKDRTYLLDLPAERTGNFYDFAGPDELGQWLERRLNELGPDVASQFETIKNLCKTSLTNPLELSRWDRIQALLNKIPMNHQVSSTRAVVEEPPTESSLSDASTASNSTPALKLHLATSGCRCLLVPSPLCSQSYANGLGNCDYFLLTPSVSWLSLRDAWTELEWLWNSAHSRPDRLFLVHIEQANQTLLHHWAKPLLNVAHDLTANMLGFSELGWPDNLRFHWSLSTRPDAFEVAAPLRSAFGAVDPEEDHQGVTWEGLDRSWWMQTTHHQPASLELGMHGEYTFATAREIGKLSQLVQKTNLPGELARQIRVEHPLGYWGKQP